MDMRGNLKRFFGWEQNLTQLLQGWEHRAKKEVNKLKRK